MSARCVDQTISLAREENTATRMLLQSGGYSVITVAAFTHHAEKSYHATFSVSPTMPPIERTALVAAIRQIADQIERAK